MPTVQPIHETYERNGFVFPIDVMSTAEASQLRADLEHAEGELAGNSEKLMLLRSYPDRLLPSFDQLIRNPKLISLVSAILGDDLMVWSSSLFLKDAASSDIVTWHQDLNYWGLDETNEITAWVALSPSNIASGCMRFIPGSHTRNIVPHVDTFADSRFLASCR